MPIYERSLQLGTTTYLPPSVGNTGRILLPTSNFPEERDAEIDRRAAEYDRAIRGIVLGAVVPKIL